MRINNNISAINTQRQMGNVNRAQSKTLEHLSSGMKINVGADGPAALVISENMRSQIAGLNQAVENSEQGISMIQTAEGALNEVNRLLVKTRQLAIHASNEGVNDQRMLEADQAEIENALQTIDRISSMTQFGTKKLLDGSRGANGVATGEGLQFVEALPETATSPIEGFAVKVDQVATKSAFQGETALTQELIDAEETITISENGKTVSYTTVKGDSIDANLNELSRQIDRAGLDVELVRNEDNVIRLQHKEYGNDHSFTVASSTAGVLSKTANVSEEAIRGKDVKGSINGEETVGSGQILTGKVGTSVEGLKVRYTGEKASEEGEIAGTVAVYQNSLKFQVGANEGQTVGVSLRDMASRSLSNGVETKSGFDSLSEINVTDFQRAQDSIVMIDKAIDQTSTERAKLGAFQQNTLESNLNNLRVAAENLTAAESTIRDADMAHEMADFTKHQILTQTSTAMLAQANQRAQSILGLL